MSLRDRASSLDENGPCCLGKNTLRLQRDTEFVLKNALEAELLCSHARILISLESITIGTSRTIGVRLER